MVDQEDQVRKSVYSRKFSYPFNTTFMIINSIFVIIAAFWLIIVSFLHWRSSECNRFQTAPRILISSFLLTMCLAGFFAAHYKSDCLYRIFFYLLFLWLFNLVCISIFLFFLHKETNPRMFAGTQIKEYNLNDFSGWVQRLVIKEDEWYRVKNCFAKDHICNSISSSYHNLTASEFYHMNLTPAQSGCCKPPLSCGFEYVQPTYWIGKPNPNNSNTDCQTWNNKNDELCFECNSCRASVIANIDGYTESIQTALSQIMVGVFIGFIGWSAWISI